jgi:fluoride exporter
VTPLLVGLGALLGAPLRYLLGSRLDSPGFPTGTLVVNVAGSFLLGLFSGLALGGHATALLGTGFCGGFTTYSSFAVQSHKLGWSRGSAYAVVTVAASLVACALGFWLVS